VTDNRSSVGGKKSQVNAWVAADDLDHARPVAAFAMVAVARSCSYEKGGLSRRNGRVSVTYADDCAKPDHKQEHQGQFCYSSHQHAIDLDDKFGPMALGIKNFSIKISAIVYEIGRSKQSGV
jgi:hypothetical protein